MQHRSVLQFMLLLLGKHRFCSEDTWKAKNTDRTKLKTTNVFIYEIYASVKQIFRPDNKNQQVNKIIWERHTIWVQFCPYSSLWSWDQKGSKAACQLKCCFLCKLEGHISKGLSSGDTTHTRTAQCEGFEIKPWKQAISELSLSVYLYLISSVWLLQ